MKRTSKNAALWAEQFAKIKAGLPEGTPHQDIVANFKTTYPRLMGKMQILQTPKEWGHRAGATVYGAKPKGEKWREWAKRKQQGSTLFLPEKMDSNLTAAAMGHELRHVADFRQKTQGHMMGRMALHRVFVPYGFRPHEWRANLSGGRQMARVMHEADSPWVDKRNLGGAGKAIGAAFNVGHAALGLVGTAARLGVVGGAIGAAIMYKKHLKKRAATVGT